MSEVISSIRDHNRQFDRLTRSAIRKLTQGHPAEVELELANVHLEELTRIVESLPEVKSDG